MDLHLHLHLDALTATLGAERASFRLPLAPPGLPRLTVDALHLDPHALLGAVEGALHALTHEHAGPPIAALRITTTTRSLLAIGRENVLLTAALVLPDGVEDIPSPPSLLPAELPLAAVRRWVGLGALLTRTLAREWIDQRHRAPAGLPLIAETGDYPRDPDRFRQLGVRLTHCPLLVPEGAVMAQVLPPIARRLGLPDFTPIYGHLG